MPDSTLIVVESPAKAKSIQKMLGAGYEVRASKGHVADLPEHELGVDIQADFAPQYEVKKDKQPVVNELKRAAKGKRVLIATDPDREGEAIGWHLTRLLGLNPQTPLRVEFHEITPRVVRAAVQNPRPIDQSLVDAQQARRVLDRLVGYQLSPVLSMEFRRRALSAGRVQSVALRLVVEREQEIEAFVPQEYWSIEGRFESEGQQFKAMLYSLGKERVQSNGKFLITSEQQAQDIVQRAKALLTPRHGAACRIESIERRERRRNAPPPFITSTLQQVASSRLGWTASRTMRVAQRLYEGIDLPEGTVGLITYMRTDSTRVSQEALAEVREFIGQFGPAYLPEKPNFFTGKKAANAQEAHEAIRPTSTKRTPEALRKHLSEEEYKLYQLIWQRFVASQMTPAIFEQTTVNVGCQDADDPLRDGAGSVHRADDPLPGQITDAAIHRLVFRAVGSVLKFDGYLRVYGYEEDGDTERTIPPLRENAPAKLLEVTPEQHFTEPPPRYTDASLVKALEEMDIGRPSTYAPTIETLERRGYLERSGKSLKPTPLGREVTGYLLKSFPDVVAYEFTAQLEARLDEIEEGKAAWPKVVREFYEPFLKDFAKVPQKLCPKCGRPLELKVSRFGQFLGCTGYPECKYTERLELKKEPEPIGEACPACGVGQLVRRYGRYGSFISCSRYPECTYTRDEAPSTGIECPKCHAGEIVQKTSKRGKPYYRCNNPACDFLSFDPLLPDKCPLCGWNEVSKGRSAAKKTHRSRADDPLRDRRVAPAVHQADDPLRDRRVAPAVHQADDPLRDGAGSVHLEESVPDKRACSNPSCERYGGPDLNSLSQRRAKSSRKTTRTAKTKAKRSSPSGATWADLEPFIAKAALTPEQAEVARLTQGEQKQVAAVAKALNQPEEAVLKLFRQAMFKLRMEYGKARKEKEVVGV